MAEIILVTGGGRSGKSSFAENLAKESNAPKTYIATCPVIDDEMKQRVELHQNGRQGDGWTTIEETLDLGAAVAQADPGGVVLVDCLTLWVNNLMYHAELSGNECSEDEIRSEVTKVLRSVEQFPGAIIFVTNEVGLGIIPANAKARKFRDCAGRCNQLFAAAAAKVYFMVSGLPMQLKPERA